MSNPPNPKQAAGALKRPVHLVPPALELGAAVAFGEGGEAYGPYNWRKTKVEAMTYVAANRLHLAAYQDGEDVDPEGKGKLHLEGIAACVGILLDSTYGGFLIDNRPPAGPGPSLTRKPAPKAATPDGTVVAATVEPLWNGYRRADVLAIAAKQFPTANHRFKNDRLEYSYGDDHWRRERWDGEDAMVLSYRAYGLRRPDEPDYKPLVVEWSNVIPDSACPVD